MTTRATIPAGRRPSSLNRRPTGCCGSITTAFISFRWCQPARGRSGGIKSRRQTIVELLRRYNVNIKGAEVVVVGRGVTVGRPLGLLLTRKSENATVTLCHTGTRDLAYHTKRADIVVMAAGVPHMLTPDMVKPGAAILDVGITRTDAGLLGDVHPDVRRMLLTQRAWIEGSRALAYWVGLMIDTYEHHPDAETREKLAAMGALPAPTTVAEFEAFIRAEVAKWAPVVKSGVKMSD